MELDNLMTEKEGIKLQSLLVTSLVIFYRRVPTLGLAESHENLELELPGA